MADCNSGNTQSPISRFEVIEPIEEDIKEPLEVVVNHLLGWGGMPLSAPWDAPMALMLIHIDFLGYVYRGDSKAGNAVKFIRDYFGKADSRYTEVGGLLYYTLRHGWIHKSTPKRLSLTNGAILGIVLSDTSQRNKHLQVYQEQEELKLRISVPLFFADMIFAIDQYCADYRASENKRKAYKTALKKLGEPETLVVCKPRYMENSDIKFILKR